MKSQIDGLSYFLSPTDIANSLMRHTMLFAYRSPLDFELLSSKLEELSSLIPELNGRIISENGSYRITKRDSKPEIKLVKINEEMPSYGVSYPLENTANSLAPEISNQLIDSDQPICSFQITYFKCGGVVLGMSSSHAIFDGIGRGWVLAQWARMCRNERNMLPLDFDRSKVDKLADHSFSNVEDEPVLRVSKNELMSSIGSLYTIPCSYKIFKVTATAIENLKNEICAEFTTEDQWISKQDVLVAKVWQSVAKAFGSQRLLKLITIEDFRRNALTGLPQYYIGNAIINSEIKFDTTEIAASPLAATAQRLRKNANNTISIKNICNQVALQKLHCHMESDEFTAWGDTSTTVDTIITVNNLSKFPLPELNFGNGLPFWSGGLERSPFRNITIFPLESGDEYAVHISLPTPIMENLISIISDDSLWAHSLPNY